MKTQTDKTQESQNSITPRVSQEPSNGGTAQLKDNRTSTIAQRKLRSGMDSSENTKAPIQRKNKTGLPDNLKSGIENLSGYSMDDVNVHYNSSKPAQLKAHAYAQGTDIHLAPGQEKHLPHEAWHVVQQKQGRVKPTRQLKSKVSINDDAGLEKEADVMGDRALQLSSTKSDHNPIQRATVHRNDVVQRGGAKANANAEENKQAVGRGIEGIKRLVEALESEDVEANCFVGVMSRYPDWKNYAKGKGGHAAIQVKIEFDDNQMGTKYIQAGVSATGSIQVEPFFQTIKTKEGYSIKRLEKQVEKATCIEVLKAIAKDIATKQPYKERIIINKGTSTNCSLWAIKMASIAGMDLKTFKMSVLPSPNDLQHSLDYFKSKKGYTLTDSTKVEKEENQIEVNEGLVPDPVFDGGFNITNNLSDEEVEELKQWALT